VYQEVIEMIRGLAMGEQSGNAPPQQAGVAGATGPGQVPPSGVAPSSLDTMGMGG
jgi:hypothetical protein